MITVFKLTHNIYDERVSLQLPFCTRSNTRGNKYKLFTTIYGNIFTAHIVNIWNSLPNSVVDANSVNAFKARLDKFWLHQKLCLILQLILVEPETDQCCHKALIGL